MGISLNWTDNKKMTPLHYAAKLGDAAMADLLVRLGADPNALDYKGRSPAALAEDKEKTFFASTLMSMGGRKLRRVAVKDEFKLAAEERVEYFLYSKSLAGLEKHLNSTVDSTHKLYRELKKTNLLLDSTKNSIFNKSIN